MMLRVQNKYLLIFIISFEKQHDVRTKKKTKISKKLFI